MKSNNLATKLFLKKILHPPFEFIVFFWQGGGVVRALDDHSKRSTEPETEQYRIAKLTMHAHA